MRGQCSHPHFGSISSDCILLTTAPFRHSFQLQAIFLLKQGVYACDSGVLVSMPVCAKASFDGLKMYVLLLAGPHRAAARSGGGQRHSRRRGRSGRPALACGRSQGRRAGRHAETRSRSISFSVKATRKLIRISIAYNRCNAMKMIEEGESHELQSSTSQV